MKMHDRKPLLILVGVVVLLLAISIPLQYLVRREVVVGLPSEEAHSHAHGEEEGEIETEGEGEHQHPEEEGHVGADVLLGKNFISNYGFEVGTREQIWGWKRIGEDQGAVIYRDGGVSYRGFASAAVNTNGVFAVDSGWYMKLNQLPRNHDVVFEGYVKTQGLRGEAYLRVLAEGSLEGQEEPQLVVSASTDDVHGDSDWTLSSLRCYIPPEATGVWLEVGVFGAGQAWFDDCSLIVYEREDLLASGENLLRNPSFSDGARYWHYYSNTVDPVVNYGNASTGPDGGPAFLLKDSTPGPPQDKYSRLSQSICGFYGHKGTLSITGWMRAENLDGNGTMGARVFKASGETGYRSEILVRGNAPWTEFKMDIPVEGDSADIWIMLNLIGTGSFYVSGLNVTFQEEQTSSQQ